VASATRDGRLSPSQRDWAITYCQADPDGFARFIAHQSPLLGLAERAEGAFGFTKRGAGASEINSRAADRLNVAERAICSKLGIKPSEYIARKSSAVDFLSSN
jgi:hypothetical protein